jgi:negative regulator of genetic competence, sporulation and motility
VLDGKSSEQTAKETPQLTKDMQYMFKVTLPKKKKREREREACLMSIAVSFASFNSVVPFLLDISMHMHVLHAN